MDITPESKQRSRSAHPVRIWRTTRCLSQAVLAKQAGVARTTVIRIEAGEKPTVKTANAVANVLGVEREAIFGGDD